LDVSLGQVRLSACLVPAPEQARHAKRALQGVFKVMVTGIDSLEIAVAASETINCPAENLRDEETVAIREHGEVGRLHFYFNRCRVSGDYRWSHLNKNTSLPSEMHALLLPWACQKSERIVALQARKPSWRLVETRILVNNYIMLKADGSDPAAIKSLDDGMFPAGVFFIVSWHCLTILSETL